MHWIIFIQLWHAINLSQVWSNAPRFLVFFCSLSFFTSFFIHHALSVLLLASFPSSSTGYTIPQFLACMDFSCDSPRLISDDQWQLVEALWPSVAGDPMVQILSLESAPFTDFFLKISFGQLDFCLSFLVFVPLSYFYSETSVLIFTPVVTSCFSSVTYFIYLYFCSIIYLFPCL